jgi:hypothetical protein
VNTEKLNNLIKKFGYDPRDEQWIEEELAKTDKEKQWFQFDRETGSSFISDWNELISSFQQKYNSSISAEQAKKLSKKRMRYVLGSFYTRLSGNGNKSDWIKAAVDFEEFHHKRENRMKSWSILHQHNYPTAKTKKPIVFWPGPYFHECIEHIPYVFTDAHCGHIRSDIILRVVSYDAEQKYIRLDFTADMRKLIKPNELSDTQPWEKEETDYDFWLKPEEITDCLEISDL